MITTDKRKGRLRMTGKVKWYSEKLHYGFIETEGMDLFFHVSGITCDPSELKDGTPVTFELASNMKSHKQMAVQVQVVDG